MDYYQITINAETAKPAETTFHSRLILRDLRVLCVQRRDRYRFSQYTPLGGTVE